jgi:alpha-glucoside transport system permease protein
MLLRPYQNACCTSSASRSSRRALFLLDYRRARAPATCSSSCCSPPRRDPAAVGLIYPAIATFVQSFFDKTGKDFVGMDNYVWVFTQPGRHLVGHQHRHLGAHRPAVATIIGLAYAVFIDRAAGRSS